MRSGRTGCWGSWVPGAWDRCSSATLPAGRAVAVNARNGHKIWEYATSAVIESGIAVANGIVYFGGGNILYAVTSWAWTARTWRGTPSVAGWPWRPACEAARQRSVHGGGPGERRGRER